MGVAIASNLKDIFADVPPGHPLFRRFSLITPDALPDYLQRLARLSAEGRLSEADSVAFLALALAYVEPRMRFGLLNPGLAARIVGARAVVQGFMHGKDGCDVEPYDPNRINPRSTVLDNLLFGRIDTARMHGEALIQREARAVFRQFDLERPIQRRGLEKEVGNRGQLLAERVRVRIGLARAIMRDPEILIIDRVDEHLDRGVDTLLDVADAALPRASLVASLSAEADLDRASRCGFRSGAPRHACAPRRSDIGGTPGPAVYRCTRLRPRMVRMPTLSDAIETPARTTGSLAGLPRVVPPHRAPPERELPIPAYLRSIRDNSLTGFSAARLRGAGDPPGPARTVELRPQRSGGDPTGSGREPGELRPHHRDDAHPAPDPRRRAPDQRGLRVAPPAPHPGAGLHPAGDRRAGAAHRRRRGGGPGPDRRRGRGRAGRPVHVLLPAGAGDRRARDVLGGHGRARDRAARLHRRVCRADGPAAPARHRDAAGLAGAARLVAGALPAPLDPVPRPDHRGAPGDAERDIDPLGRPARSAERRAQSRYGRRLHARRSCATRSPP